MSARNNNIGAWETQPGKKKKGKGKSSSIGSNDLGSIVSPYAKSGSKGFDDTRSSDFTPEKISRLSDHLKRFATLAEACIFMMPVEDLEAAEREFRPELDREKEIRGLRAELETLEDKLERQEEYWNAEKQDLENELNECEKAKKILQRENDEVKKEVARSQKEAKKEQDRSLKKEREKLDKEKGQEVTELQSQLRKLKDSNKRLEGENKNLSEKLKMTMDNFEEERTSATQMRGAYESTIKSLVSDQDKLKSELSITDCKPTEFYTDRFNKLAECIREVVRARFEVLPEGLEKEHEPFKKILEGLQTSSEIFRYTPASSDPISNFLRRCGVEQVISTRICKFIVRPFMDGSSPELNGSERILDTIQQRLSRCSEQKKDMWTALTIKGIGTCDEEHLKSSMTQDILEELKCISEQRNRQELEIDLTPIVDAALELWFALRSDSCRLKLNFEPDLESKATWLSPKTPFVEVSQNGNSERSTIAKSIDAPPSFALFPRVVIFRDDGGNTVAHTGSNGYSGRSVPNEKTAEEPVVVYQGQALFSDSEAFVQGVNLQKELDEMYTSHMSAFRVKKKSLSSPVLDKSFIFPLPSPGRGEQRKSNGEIPGMQAGE